MTDPIRPDDVIAVRQRSLPDEVLEAFNDLIARNFSGNRATVLQKDAARLIVRKMRESDFRIEGCEVTEAEVYGNHWLDVEDVYREAGWKVEYDKPGHNESYFRFSKGEVAR